MTYTHTIQTTQYGIVGIKSKTINLNQFTGIVSLDGIVERQQADMYIIEVSFMTWNTVVATWALADLSGMNNGLYLPDAGIYLSLSALQKYALENQWVGWELKLQNALTSQSITIAYFKCSTSSSNTNCSALQKTFSTDPSKTFTTSHGDKFYKSSDVNSRFMTNGNLFGYFINDIPDNEVSDVANALLFPNTQYVQDTLLPGIASLCTDGTDTITTVKTNTLNIDTNGLVLTLRGDVTNGSATCKIYLDPSNPALWQKLSFTVATTASSSDIVWTNPQTSSAKPIPSGQQFPINLEKTLSFTSSRGHTITFPSSKISYSAVAVDEDLGIAGLRCSSQMNVVDYANDAFVETNPAVKVFECKSKTAVTNIASNLIAIPLSDGRTFIIEIIDSARTNFANNISITLN